MKRPALRAVETQSSFDVTHKSRAPVLPLAVSLGEPHENPHPMARCKFQFVRVSEEEIRLLGQVGFPQERCINYLTPDEAHEEIRTAWQSREYRS